MKKSLSIFTILFILLLTKSASANDESSLYETKNYSEKIVLDLTSLRGSSVFCQISNSEGVIIFSEELSINKERNKIFNLENLESGQYLFRISDDVQVTYYKVTKNESGIRYMDKNEKIFRPTIVNRGNGTIDFHLLALGKNIEMEIVNSKGQKLFQQSYSDLETISKRLTIKQTSEGQYTVKVKIGDEVFYNELSL